MLLKLNNLAILNGNVTCLPGKWCIFLRINNTEVLHAPHLQRDDSRLYYAPESKDGVLLRWITLNSTILKMITIKTKKLEGLSGNSNYGNDIAQLL